jgi:hypothetical protein
MNWNYKREETPRAQAGDHRFEIVAAEAKVSQAGNDMIVITLKLNGYDVKVKHYIVHNEYFNRNMTNFFDSVNIDDGDFNLPGWVGAVGAARFKEDDQGYLKVAYFIDKKRAEKLPAWQGEMPERQTVTTLSDAKFEDVTNEDDLPF